MAAVSGDRRRRVHRLAHGRGAACAAASACAWSTAWSRASGRTWPRWPTASSSSKAISRTTASRTRRPRAWTTCCTRRPSRRCRARWPSRCLSPGQRRRHAQRAGGRAGRGRARLVFAGSSSVYGNIADAAEARGHAARPADAVRAPEAHGRAVRKAVHVALRPGDGDDAILQRVRAAAGPLVAVLGRDFAVHPDAAGWTAPRPSTATASRRATSPTWPTSWTAC